MAEMKHRPVEEQEDKIDIISGLVRGWKMFKKTWWLLIVLVVISAGAVISYVKLVYTPEYEASASFSVSSGNGSYQNNSYMQSISMAQLSATFPYILESGALKKVICEDLGMSSLQGTITASVVEDTNLFQIRVRSGSAQTASDILESVIANYPEVAKYIIGDTTLTMLDNTGVPTAPCNGLNLKYELVKGGLAACVIYFLIAALLAAARKTVSSEDDLKRYTSIRCLAGIPKTYMKKRSGKHQQLMLIDQKVTPAFAESINTLRIRTMRELQKENAQVVLVTSTSEGEGKTTLASNLALSYAMKGYRTLLIDGDLRHPSVGGQFGLQVNTGIAEVLKGKAEFHEAVAAYEETGLDILPGSKAVNNNGVAALLNSEAMKQLIKNCRDIYEYIIIDTPPCSMMQDAAAMTEFSDSVLLVIRQDYTARNRILGSMELLTETGITILGYVINGEENGIGSYGYGRYGYGRYGYGKYGKYSQYRYGEKQKKDEQPVE